MKTIALLDAKTIIATAAHAAVTYLPVCDPHQTAVHEALSRFSTTEHSDFVHMEFSVSFQVTASLSVTRAIGTSSPTFVVSVSASSGVRTLSQQQAAHDLMGDVLRAAHRIQAVIDELPTIAH